MTKFAYIKNWFSNYSRLDEPYEYQNVLYYTVENFYQAMKTYKHNIDIRKYIASLSPGKAKKFWRINGNKKKHMRKDWREMNLEVMDHILHVKFAKDTSWHKALMKTKGPIVEWNNWHDKFFGKCVCAKCQNEGENHLGKMLESIREEFSDEESIL